ncbi:membrane protein [Intrasporangium chromatireducens Q5-1]|uniref:Membrane protein n=1 Tax=Intrasporangium chromatireducens Q5-1 TaxID=584657 RepID=W9GHR4_9MICO|nr:cation transporter [Intrasporangium chromatireducens]EWT05610.1 membrane protein [Intrasporangium chromatireducens Q5-1]
MSTERSESTAAAPSTALSLERRRQLGRRAQLLAGASVGYNMLEAAISVAAGAAASSAALIGFGLDSLVEVGSGLVILWQFRHPIPETREKQALRLIAVSFFALAIYVTVDSVRTLTGSGEASPSTLGIAIAAASLLVMPFLSWAQRRTGRQLGSGSVVADSKQTLLCTYLSAVLLLGLLANALLGWSWADPVAALVIAGVAVREGIEAWRGEACECGPTSLIPDWGSGEAPSCDDGCCDGAETATSSSTPHSRPRPGQGR